MDPGEKSRPLPPLPSVGVRPPLRPPGFTRSRGTWASVWAVGPRPGWADVRAGRKPPFPGMIPQLVTLRALWLPHPECEEREVSESPGGHQCLQCAGSECVFLIFM